ncbi:uncharacterized protein K489DRAFT_401149 [Dissoconium aciculare CBS 342.82]|uniref:Ubiquitin 3 binding protein But2 C-terminal domain-containing protein n=1 Tax=Dissoconium aciculare CBS 342.82 TaxID=1314786 RepID=A0A6J3M8I7_9PEZI|nr:uncharacterized protein K489DRAFT_401149 [Dissoconium aciculare CBS 342.82]KAF1823914.1 hypothetical protein K489DRAFT_401149 [Dissoconium aciculare CBS 342.82]
MIPHVLILVLSGLAHAYQPAHSIKVRSHEDTMRFTPLEGVAAEGSIVRFSSSADELSLYGWTGESPCGTPSATTYRYAAENTVGSGVTLEIVAADCQVMFLSVVDPAEYCDPDYVFTLRIEPSSQSDNTPSPTAQPFSVDTDCASTPLTTRATRPTLVKRPGFSLSHTRSVRLSTGTSSFEPRPTCLEKLKRPTYSVFPPSPTSRQSLTFPSILPPRSNITTALQAIPTGPQPATGGSTTTTPYLLMIALVGSYVICNAYL